MSSQAAELSRLISYLIIAAIAAYLFFEAGSLPASRWEPLGAGSFPRLVFGLLVALCLTASLGSVRKLLGTSELSSYGAEIVRWIRQRRLVVLVFSLFAVYLIVIPMLGFALASFGFLLATMLLLAPRTPRSWLIAAVLAVIFSYGLAALFADAFNVFLPRAR